MNGQMLACLALGIILLVGPAGAQIPDDIKINADQWVTAGSGGAVPVTVQVLNDGDPVGGIIVDLAVDSAYGCLSPARVVTENDTNSTSYGSATVYFTPGTRSGTATITAMVVHAELAEPLTESAEQRIDHATPDAVADLWYDPEVTVGETTEIVVQMVDCYGNIVDSRNATENVEFMVGAPAGFVVGGSCMDEASVPVDAVGNATVTLRVDRAAGENLVWIQPPAPVKSTCISITGAADGAPTDITCKVVPTEASVPANGKDKITLMYTLFDAYGNPARGQGLWVNSSGLQGQSKLIKSSFSGEVWVTYGPEECVGIVTITAAAILNPDVTNTTKVEFTSTDPVDMLLTASPQTMASRDRNPDVVSELRAKVMDIRGNPVAGETVTFTIDVESINLGGSTSTGDPYLEREEQTVITADTDEDGYAKVKFHPGSFAYPRAGERATAKGTVVVQATWENATQGCHVTRDICLTWMNYPYLSVETEVSRAAVSVNSTDGVSNTTDVTIRLKGDGYAMQPDPIGVVLCTDRSGSMLYDNPDRMYSVREAGKSFVDQFSENYDRAGTVSFGRKGYIERPGINSELGNRYINNVYNSPKTYDDYATLDIGLTYDFPAVKNALDGIVPDHGTPLRHGLKVSIDHLVAPGDDGSVRAVVLLTDGDYNWYGDPLARGTGSTYPSRESYGTLTQNYYWYTDLPAKWQNMSAYAADNEIRIFTISYSESLSNDAKLTLRKVAESTGGKYYHAPGPEKLGPIYTEIAGELKTEAGVDTSMTIFKNVEVDGTAESAADLFDYVHKNGESTTIESWIKNETGNYTIIPSTTIDQTLDWERDKQLHFDIGTVRLNQTWAATFRVAVKPSYVAGDDNNINIFGDDAIISFNNDEEKLPLPDTFITVFPDLTNTGITSSSLDVRFTGPESDSGPYVDLVPLTWSTTYNGTKGVDVCLAHSRHEDMRSPITFFTKTLDCEKFIIGGNTTTVSTLMDARDLAPGKYWVTVTTSARDARTAEDTTFIWVHIKDPSRSHIKIE